MQNVRGGVVVAFDTGCSASSTTLLARLRVLRLHHVGECEDECEGDLDADFTWIGLGKEVARHEC